MSPQQVQEEVEETVEEEEVEEEEDEDEGSVADAPADAGLAAVSSAMHGLQALIDDFLDGPRGADPTPARLPSPPTTPTPRGDDRDDKAGWDRAIAVRGRTDPQRGWIQANAALRRGDNAKAFELFRAEADRAADTGDDSRAAIAYRMASDAAAALGRRDTSDHDLRRAGKHYLLQAESPSSSLQTMYSSYLAASRCFLAVGNLELTQSCVARALSLQQAMNEDMHTRFNGPVPQPD